MNDLTKAAQELVELLLEKNKTISTAESCTGGMISQYITCISGSSQVFGFGFVTYANEAKVKLIGVKEETLEAYGAVSHQTAREMAMGAKKTSQADIAIAVTGIAGPTGGSAEKKVGLVYIAIAADKGCETFEFNFSGDRQSVREQTTINAINIAIKHLKMS